MYAIILFSMFPGLSRNVIDANNNDRNHCLDKKKKITTRSAEKMIYFCGFVVLYALVVRKDIWSGQVTQHIFVCGFHQI